jgi:hypothetical protein
MGYFSNLHLEMQEDNAHTQSEEPDFMAYAHEVMATEEFARDMVDHDRGYDEYKEKRAGVFPEIDLGFLDIRKGDKNGS